MVTYTVSMVTYTVTMVTYTVTMVTYTVTMVTYTVTMVTVIMVTNNTVAKLSFILVAIIIIYYSCLSLFTGSYLNNKI